MAKTEMQKMRSQEEYSFRDPEVAASLEHARRLCAKLASTDMCDSGYRAAIEELIPGIPLDSCVCPPFKCDHGHGIRMGANSFINSNCTILDSATVDIGDNVKIGPCCQLYTPVHPMGHLSRRKPVEKALPISIGDDTWLCGGVVVCPGVSIGRRCIIAAGAVVTKDIPDDSMAAGVPAEVKKRLPREGSAE